MKMLNENDMVERYGEVCTRTKAAQILSRSVNTVNAMIRDGRLNPACGGTMVDVRSIASYIAMPDVRESEGRLNRLMKRRDIGVAV